jgi:hypothetical protein
LRFIVWSFLQGQTPVHPGSIQGGNVTVERAERNVSIDNIARIAKGLHVDPWKLLKDD